MMKRLVQTTAIVLITATAMTPLTSAAARAESHASAAMSADIFMPTIDARAVRASDLIGMRVYVPEAVNPDLMEVGGLNDGWDDIGEVSDLVVSRDGTVVALLIDIGGFMGIGERTIAVAPSGVRFVADTSTDQPDDFFLVLDAVADAVGAAPAYDPEARQFSQPASDDDRSGHGFMRDGYVLVLSGEVTAEQLTDASVYGPDGERIGEVSRIELSTDGEVRDVIIDVGGFLGLGEKPVALRIDQLQILREVEGDEVVVHVPFTADQLEQMPTWQN